MRKSLAALLGLALCISETTPGQRAIIYVHGTLLSGAIALNPFKVYYQQPLDHSLYDVTLDALRHHPLYYEDHMLGSLGLHEVNKQLVDTFKARECTPTSYYMGIVPVIAAVDCLCPDENLLHYTFGWSGALSLLHRKEAGFSLYFELVKFRKKHPTIDITLICHSHGGNVAAYLAAAEERFKKKLNINTLLLLGTPIQQETVQYFGNPMFKRVINCYSRGDRIQPNDWISVASRKSRKTIGSMLDFTPRNQIIDTQLIVNNNDAALGHRELFALKKYYIPSNPWVHAPFHNFFKALDPLPICIFMPTIAHLINGLNPTSGLYPAQIDFIQTPNNVSCKIDLKNLGSVSTDNLCQSIQQAQELARACWQPHARTSESAKIWHATKQAVKKLFRRRK